MLVVEHISFEAMPVAHIKLLHVPGSQCIPWITLPLTKIMVWLPMYRGSEPIHLEKDAIVSLTCNQTQRASSKLLPISCPAFDWFDLRPGAPVFIGQYLFTGRLCTTL